MSYVSFLHSFFLLHETLSSWWLTLHGALLLRFVQQVISTKMDKTVVVRVTRTYPHPKYGKRMQKTKNFYAHDEENACNEGDIVVVEASRPMSRLKRWTLKEIVETAVEK